MVFPSSFTPLASNQLQVRIPDCDVKGKVDEPWLVVSSTLSIGSCSRKNRQDYLRWSEWEVVQYGEALTCFQFHRCEGVPMSRDEVIVP